MTHPLKDLEPVAPFDMARRPFRRCPPKGLVVRAPNEQRRDTDGRQREQGTWRAARHAMTELTRCAVRPAVACG